MLIDLAILPSALQEHILQGEHIEVAYHGKVVADVMPKPKIDDEYGVFGILKGVDGVKFQNELRAE